MTFSDLVAVAALLVSLASSCLTLWWRAEDQRGADVIAYFHRTRDLAQVSTRSGEVRTTGYNMVLWNRGKEAAKDLEFHISDSKKMPIELDSVEGDEFPLDRLEPEARYPIPWIPLPSDDGRLFRCRVSWTDSKGPQSREVQIRRGETSV